MAMYVRSREDAFGSDAEAAEFVAGLLQISDYELFRISCEEFGSCDIRSNAVEQAFSAYLHRGEVPFWVREFVRKELVKVENGELIEPEQFGILRRTPTPYEKLLGYIMMGLAVILTMLFSWFAGNSQPF